MKPTFTAEELGILQYLVIEEICRLNDNLKDPHVAATVATLAKMVDKFPVQSREEAV